MTERRFYVRPEDAGAGVLTLRAEEAHHARRVLRLEPGDAVVCFDGRGRAWDGRVEAFERDLARVAIVGERPVVAEPRPRVVLVQGLVKGDRMDAIVQKAAELGAARVVPLRADRSEVRLDAGRADRRADRWERIVVEAAKQCERAWLPEVALPQTLDAALDAVEGAAIAFVERDGAPAKLALAALGTPVAVTLFVGPEGGWSDRERALFAERSVLCLSLGPNVLRAETAAVAALAIVTYALAPTAWPHR